MTEPCSVIPCFNQRLLLCFNQQVLRRSLQQFRPNIHLLTLFWTILAFKFKKISRHMHVCFNGKFKGMNLKITKNLLRIFSNLNKYNLYVYTHKLAKIFSNFSLYVP